MLQRAESVMVTPMLNNLCVINGQFWSSYQWKHCLLLSKLSRSKAALSLLIFVLGVTKIKDGSFRHLTEVCILILRSIFTLNGVEKFVPYTLYMLCPILSRGHFFWHLRIPCIICSTISNTMKNDLFLIFISNRTMFLFSLVNVNVPLFVFRNCCTRQWQTCCSWKSLDCHKSHLSENRFMLVVLVSTSFIFWIISQRNLSDVIECVHLESQWLPGQNLANWTSVILSKWEF